MNEDELAEAIARLASTQTDAEDVEVKESVGKLPTSIVETLSAFANGSGGTIILGLSEKHGFAPAEGFDARRMADALAQTCADKLTPPVRASIRIMSYRSSQVVVCVVDEFSPKDKPCYVTARGMYRGSFIREFDADHRLSPYEIDRLIDEKTQPQYDAEIVSRATMDDLDADLLAAVIKRQRDLHPRVFAHESDDEIAVSFHIATNDSGTLRPTLAGLLALGTYPQQYFPRLNVTFACYPGTDKASNPQVKFLDSESMVGPIPVMIDDTIAAVARNMRIGGVMDGYKRVDAPDYPIAAVREAVCNALMHRDYSPMARGSQVQVNLYTDRLEILSPGGLFGTVTPETIAEAGYSSTRNQFLANILESTPYQGGFVAENRGTGFRLIESELAHNGMQPPIVKDSISMFSLTFARSGTSEDNAKAQRQRRAGRRQTPSNRRRDSQQSPGQHVSNEYEPRSAASSDTLNLPATSTEITYDIIDFIAANEPCSASEIARALDIPRSTLTYQLKKLTTSGTIERLGVARSRNQKYRIA